jgi:hypothetical protein
MSKPRTRSGGSHSTLFRITLAMLVNETTGEMIVPTRVIEHRGTEIKYLVLPISPEDSRIVIQVLDGPDNPVYAVDYESVESWEVVSTEKPKLEVVTEDERTT